MYGSTAIVLNHDGTPYTPEVSIGFTCQAMAYDGTNWYVCGAGANALGCFISTSGLVLGRADPNPNGTDGKDEIAVTFSNGSYFIIWNKWDNGFYSISAAVLSPSGTFQASGTIFTEAINRDIEFIGVSGGNGKFLVTWDNPNPGIIQVYGQVFNSSLVSQTGVFTIHTGSRFASIETVSAYSASNNEWYAVYLNTDSSHLNGNRVSPTGSVQAVDVLTSDNVTDNYPRLAWNSQANEMMIVYGAGAYSGQHGSPSYYKVFAQRFDMSPLPSPGSFAGAVQSTSSIQWSWAAVTGATGYVVKDSVTGNQIGQVGSGTLSFTETVLSDNFLASRYVQALASDGTSNPSTTVALYTKIHDPTTADYTLEVASSTQINVAVVPPHNSTSGSTGVKIERQNGSKWTLLQGFAATYTFNDTGRTANTSYTYRITFQNGNAVASAVSPTESVTTAITTAPAGFAGSPQTSTSIQWSWNDVVGETGFQVLDSSETVKGTTGFKVVTFTETGLAENTQYTRHARAVDGVGSSGDSGSASVYTKVHDPTSSDFSAVLTTSTQISITVTPPNNSTTGSTGCEIGRSTENVNWTVVKAFSSVYSYSDSSITAGTTYYYRIRFQNAAAQATSYSPSSASWTGGLTPVILTGSKKTRNPNTGIIGTAPADSVVKVYFNGTLDGTATNANGNWSYSATTKAEGTYTVTATATEGGNTSGNSNLITVTIDLTPPVPPANVKVRPYNNTIDVLWDASTSSDLAGYQVWRKTGTGSFTNLSPTQLILGTQYRDSTATNGTAYTYYVTAVDNARND
jgi:hypothetical protein